MDFEITGTIVAVLPARSGVSNTSGREWHEQQFVVETDGQYPKKVCLSVKGERAKQFYHRVNERVKCKFSIDAQCYSDKWFNKIECFSVENV